MVGYSASFVDVTTNALGNLTLYYTSMVMTPNEEYIAYDREVPCDSSSVVASRIIGFQPSSHRPIQAERADTPSNVSYPDQSTGVPLIPMTRTTIPAAASDRAVENLG